MKRSVINAFGVVAVCCTSLVAAEPKQKMALDFTAAQQPPSATPSQKDSLIQLALLIDTSGSMEGLVDQARYQLWNVVSDLAKARRGTQTIRLEIGVYQYGTDRVAKSKDCLRQIVGFTEDLDEVSRGLFSLHVSGGDEYCASAIARCLDDLEWSSDPSVYKAVFIAGNESFDQGKTTLGEVLPAVKQKSVFLNTVYCGTKYEGRPQWDVAAKIAGGLASFIDHNHHLPNMPTPYDARMRELNEEMNETFVWYGKGAAKAASNQGKQDRNADKMSDHAFAARMSAKIGHLYHHIDHDLVDAINHGHASLDKMPESLMPPVLSQKSSDERRTYMDEMIARRSSVRRRMAEVLSQRQRFLENELLKRGVEAKTVLGDALGEAIKDQAATLGYTFSGDQSLASKQSS
ncbi:MAG: vWA domain-containing protein [Planctomycetota bacterium]